jgi:hypothetical protein
MATAEIIARALGGGKAGGGWTARCSAHDDRCRLGRHGDIVSLARVIIAERLPHSATRVAPELTQVNAP